MNTKQSTQWKDWDGQVSGWAAGSWMWNVLTHRQKGVREKWSKKVRQINCAHFEELPCCIITEKHRKSTAYHLQVGKICSVKYLKYVLAVSVGGWVDIQFWSKALTSKRRHQTPNKCCCLTLWELLSHKKQVSCDVSGEENDGWLNPLCSIC